MAENENVLALKEIFERRRENHKTRMKYAKRWSTIAFAFLITLGFVDLVFGCTFFVIKCSISYTFLIFIPLTLITIWIAIMFFIQRNNEGTHFTAMESNDHKLAMIELWLAEDSKNNIFKKTLTSLFDGSNTEKELNVMLQHLQNNQSHIHNYIAGNINNDIYDKLINDRDKLQNSIVTLNLKLSKYIEEKETWDNISKNHNILLTKIFNELTNNSTAILAGNGKNKLDIEYLGIIKQLTSK